MLNDTPERVRAHVGVCICTFRRPKMLSWLLSAIAAQLTSDLFTISVTIVDNDWRESARTEVDHFGLTASIPVAYVCEPEQNIAKARNHAIEHSYGSHVAFIDDDEIPEANWLLSLYALWRATGASGVLGPVRPRFETCPPSWIIKSRILERPDMRTGSVLDWRQTRTGNALLERRLFDVEGYRFDVAYGRGGEDRDLFRRMIDRGEHFIWCREAVVHEIIPATRFRRLFQMKRALLRGKIAIPVGLKGVQRLAKSIAAVFLYLPAMLFMLPFSHAQFMKYLIRTCDHLGSIAAFFGIELVREEYLS